MERTRSKALNANLECRELCKRLQIAQFIFKTLNKYNACSSFRIVGSTVSHSLIRPSSDLDLHVISNIIDIPFELANFYRDLPQDIYMDYRRGVIDVIAFKDVIDNVKVSIQYFSLGAIIKISKFQDKILKIYRTSPTRTDASLYGFKNEYSINLCQFSCNNGFLLLVPNDPLYTGEFRMNMYHHMLLTGINVKDNHNINYFQNLLIRTLKSYSSSDIDIMRLFGSRTQHWSDEYIEYIKGRFKNSDVAANGIVNKIFEGYL